MDPGAGRRRADARPSLRRSPLPTPPPPTATNAEAQPSIPAFPCSTAGVNLRRLIAPRKSPRGGKGLASLGERRHLMSVAARLTRGHPFTEAGAIGSVGAMVALMFMSSTLLTPLYSIYRETFHFSKVVLTLIYSAYVVGNLSALLFFGRLSDQVGRRPVTLSAIGLAVVATVLFL